MNKLKLVGLLLLILSLSLTSEAEKKSKKSRKDTSEESDEEKPDSKHKGARAYVDKLISNVHGQIARSKDVKNFVLPAFNTSFKDDPMVFEVNGVAMFKEGKAKGFDDIEKSHGADVTVEDKGKTVISFQMAWKEIKLEQEGKLKYGKLPKVPISASGEVTKLKANLTIKIKDDRASLVKFECNHKEECNVDFSGVGPLNKRLQKLVEKDYKSKTKAALLEHFESSIKPVVEETIKTTLYKS